MAEASFTFSVEEDLKAAFAEAAKAHDQTGAQLLRRFMREYVQGHANQLDYDAWFRRQVETALESANAGRLVPDDDIETEFAARRAETMSKLGRSST